MAERDAAEDLKICEAATPGPWETVRANMEGPYMIRMSYPRGGMWYGMRQIHFEPDAVFAAMSREALPYWIREAQAQRERAERAEKENKLNQEIFKAIHGIFGYGDEPTDLVTYIAEDVGRMRAAVEAACRWGASSRDNRLLDAMRLEDALSAYRAESCPAKEEEQNGD